MTVVKIYSFEDITGTHRPFSFSNPVLQNRATGSSRINARSGLSNSLEIAKLSKNFNVANIVALK